MWRGFEIITWTFLLRCGRKVDDVPLLLGCTVGVVVACNVLESDCARTESCPPGRCVVTEVVAIFPAWLRA